jgi:malonate decarboxylase epsilon subunit
VSVALLFPGQGAQRPGFLHRLPVHADVRATLDEAAAVLCQDVLELDRAEALVSTTAVQLGIVIASVAVARALRREGLLAEAAAGLSVGAFAAAVSCGSLDFADALHLVRLRGESMEKAYPRGYGMAALIGLDEQQVRALVQQVGGAEAQLYIANLNAPKQIVVSGAETALETVMALACKAGALKAERMSVSVPSHCPLLNSVSQALAAAMQSVVVRVPTFAYVTNVRGRAVHDAEGVRDDLIRNVSHTVRWADCVTVLYELGSRLFVEPPPGRVLSNLARSEFSQARAVAVEDAGIEPVVGLALHGRAVLSDRSPTQSC